MQGFVSTAILLVEPLNGRSFAQLMAAIGLGARAAYVTATGGVGGLMVILLPVVQLSQLASQGRDAAQSKAVINQILLADFANPITRG